MKTNDYVFVYGTLRKGERMDLSNKASFFNIQYMGQDKINGNLYHLGGFPGIKLIPEAYVGFDPNLAVVLGDIFLIGDSSIAAILDSYEGYRPDNPKDGLYDREIVFTQKGRQAWVYTYNHPIIADQLIETGDWKNPRLGATHRIPIR